ncbi:MAG: mobile mystery protein B [Pseudomonadota bacterium]|nr:mobile mystery protein B [Pseudomonadota bacterium]
MAMSREAQDGQTPLDPDETAGLIPRHILTKGALDDWEQENILQAIKWLRRARVTEVLTERFCRELHRRMFDQTWEWAGTFRVSNKNIGCDWPMVPGRLKQLLDNARYWVAHQTFVPDESAARFHHALVWIHPFPNGNGRHSRMMTDALLRQLGRRAFSWGGAQGVANASAVRARYLAALRMADQNDFARLLDFVRS